MMRKTVTSVKQKHSPRGGVIREQARAQDVKDIKMKFKEITFLLDVNMVVSDIRIILRMSPRTQNNKKKMGNGKENT